MARLNKDQKREGKYLRKLIKNWMVADLFRMMKQLPPEEWRLAGYCSYPIVLYVFSCMEFLGYLVSEEEYNETSKSYSKKRIWAYMKLAFPPHIFKELASFEPVFTDLFRNGLSHNYGAKSCGISRGAKKMLYFSDGMLTLDADKFAKAFIKSSFFFDWLFTKKKALEMYPGMIDRIIERSAKVETINSKYFDIIKDIKTNSKYKYSEFNSY